MTEDIDHYKFDFATATEDLRAQFDPAKARNVIFVNIAAFPPDTPGGAPNIGMTPIGDAQFLQEYQDRAFNLTMSRSGGQSGTGRLMNKDKTQLGNVVSIVADDGYVHTFGEKYEDLMRLWILYHEAGHALVKNADISAGPDDTYGENAGDAMASLLFLRRFGPDAKAFLSMISWSRAFQAINAGDTKHLTTAVIDKILNDSGDTDFSKLTFAQTVQRAQEYAAQWTPNAAALSTARDVFSSAIKDGGRLRDILNRILSRKSPPDLASFMAGKVSEAMVRKEGMEFFGTRAQLPDKERAALASDVSAGLAGMKVNHLFNSAAIHSAGTTPLLSLAPLGLSAGKPLVFGATKPPTGNS